MVKVKKIKSESPVQARRVTKSDVTDAYNLHMATRIIEALYDEGLIDNDVMNTLKKAAVSSYAKCLERLY